MTVCIAARCSFVGSPFIIAASDRMITSGDIEFEQPIINKIFQLAPHCVACVFGSIPLQSRIAVATAERVRKEGLATVEQIADAYAFEYEVAVRRTREARFLWPISLTYRAFLEREKELSPTLRDKLLEQLQEYDLADGGAVIAGADATGGHVYYVSRPGVANPYDYPGFVAGGEGGQHAESLFMFERFTPAWDFSRTLYLVVAAKRRAEVAPGVGRDTDIILIPTNPPNLYVHDMNSPLIKGVATLYERVEKTVRQRHQKAYQDVDKLIEDFLKPPAPEPGAQGPLAEPSSLISSEPSASEVPTQSERK